MTLSPRIANLLDAVAEAQSDLHHAQTPAQAEAARADIHAIRHSLFLAGHHFQTEEEAA